VNIHVLRTDAHSVTKRRGRVGRMSVLYLGNPGSDPAVDSNYPD
jgi:hypothetical protein